MLFQLFEEKKLLLRSVPIFGLPRRIAQEIELLLKHVILSFVETSRTAKKN